MDGKTYFTQELVNGNIPRMLIMMSVAQMSDNDDAMMKLFEDLVVKAFEDGKNDEHEVLYKEGYSNLA